MSPEFTPHMFCQCSDYQIRPVISQAPTQGAAFRPCAYTTQAIPDTSISSVSTATFADPSLQDLRKSSSDLISHSPSQTSLAPLATVEINDIAIPLWGACSSGISEICAPGSRCICKDQWYSQCRIPIQGSYAPPGESWLCAQNESLAIATLSTLGVSLSSIASSSFLIHSLPNNGTLVQTQSLVSKPESRHSLGLSLGSVTSPSSVIISVPAPLLSRSRIDPSWPWPTSSPLQTSRLMSSFTSKGLGPTRTSSSKVQPSLAYTHDRISEELTSLITATSKNRSMTAGTTSAMRTYLQPIEHLTNTSSPLGALISITSSRVSSVSTNTISFHPRITIGSESIPTSAMIPLSPTIVASSQDLFAVANPQAYQSLPVSPSSSQHPSGQVSSSESHVACPSSGSQKEAAAARAAKRNTASICDWLSGNQISNLSSTAETPNGNTIAPSKDMNPDISGTYLQTNATPEQQSQCSNYAAHQIRECWEILNVTGFIEDWVAFNQEKCDQEMMGFADCFQYLEFGGGANCSSFTGRSQCPAPDASIFAGRLHAAQIFYVAFNIWNIQNWFFSYWLAIVGANGITADNIAAICRILNLPLPKPFPLLQVLATLAFALGLISPSGWGAKIPVLGEATRNALTAIEVPGEYLLRAVQNTPTLARNLLDTGDKSKTEVQVGQIGSDMAMIVSQLQTNIQNAIVEVMGNFTVFMDFVSGGYFSTQIENLNTITVNTTLAFQTYVVSQALQDDSVVITRAVDTDVNALVTNGTYSLDSMAYDIGCTQGYNEWGMCDNWWYDAENHVSYGLLNQKAPQLNYTATLEAIFDQRITTPEMLFRGSQICANAAGSTQGNAPGTSLVTDVGVWNAECIANLKICTWELSIFSQQHEFTDCPSDHDFAMEGCGEGVDINQARVPINYIGPWLLSGQFTGIVCNKRP